MAASVQCFAFHCILHSSLFTVCSAVQPRQCSAVLKCSCIALQCSCSCSAVQCSSAVEPEEGNCRALTTLLTLALLLTENTDTSEDTNTVTGTVTNEDTHTHRYKYSYKYRCKYRWKYSYTNHKSHIDFCWQKQHCNAISSTYTANMNIAFLQMKEASNQKSSRKDTPHKIQEYS